MSDAGLFLREGSALLPFARTIAWLWRLPIHSEPGPSRVGIGGLDEADELAGLLAARELAGAAAIGSRPGPDRGRLPGRLRVTGIARFELGAATRGRFSVLQGHGVPVVSSSLGVHALRDGHWLTLAFDPDSGWGTLQDFWCLPALADFLSDLLARPMAMLPPMGLLRYDDVPGTAAQQLNGADKPDRRVERRIRRLLAGFRDAGATVNLAIASRALAGGEEVPLERIWPRSIEALAAGIAEGAAEPIAHGYLHLDRRASTEGRVEPREFAALDRSEASRRIASSLEWAESRLGARPHSFVAPNWAYSEGAIEALAEIGVPAWLPARPGPLVEGPNVRESLVSTLDGLCRVDYRPLRLLAASGLPPTVVTHGGLLDARFVALRTPGDLAALARLAIRRDLARLPGIGLRWVGASELIERLRAHDQVEVAGAEIRAPDGVEVVPGGAGRR
jgi:hypothetical protein